MKRIFFIFFLLSLFSTDFVWAQSKKPAPAPAPAAPPRPRVPPPQYVQKKDFDAKISELESRVRSAQNAGSTARNLAGEMADSLSGMGYKISEIESILNSANFKINLNEDSLKSTQTRIDELRSDMDKNLKEVQAKNESQQNLIWTLLALCIVLPVTVFIMMMLNNRKTHLELRNIGERVNNDLQKNYISLQDAMKTLKTNVDGEVYNIKADAHHKLTQESDNLKRSIRELQNALNNKMDKPEESES